MKGDLLEAATRALRDEGASDDGDGRLTRARVMASLHQGKVKRRTRLAFVLPIAACLAAGTAWGAATGRLPAVFHAIGQLVSYRSQPAHEPKGGAAPRAPPGVEGQDGAARAIDDTVHVAGSTATRGCAGAEGASRSGCGSTCQICARAVELRGSSGELERRFPRYRWRSVSTGARSALRSSRLRARASGLGRVPTRRARWSPGDRGALQSRHLLAAARARRRGAQGARAFRLGLHGLPPK
jgi:hypothetical protein